MPSNIEIRRYTTFITVLVLVLIVFSKMADANSIESTQPLKIKNFPISIPLKSNIDTPLIVNFAIRESRLYALRLSYLFQKEDQRDRARVRALAVEPLIEKGKSYGAPVKISFSISRIDKRGLIPVVEVDVDSSEIPVTSWGGDAFHKELASFQLEPGAYSLAIERSEVASQLETVITNLEIVTAYRGK
jgi:Domain of unknown function (DUF5625)